MGEHKRPKPPKSVLERPTPAIFALKMAVATFKATPLGEIDPDTRDYMADLARVMAWLDQLEAAKAPTLN